MNVDPTVVTLYGPTAPWIDAIARTKERTGNYYTYRGYFPGITRTETISDDYTRPALHYIHYSSPEAAQSDIPRLVRGDPQIPDYEVYYGPTGTRQFGGGDRETSFGNAVELLRSDQVLQYIVDPENQMDVPSGLTRVTLIGLDGREYDVVARYDLGTRQIFPPN